jgi:hypothetical protein
VSMGCIIMGVSEHGWLAFTCRPVAVQGHGRLISTIVAFVSIFDTHCII